MEKAVLEIANQALVDIALLLLIGIVAAKVAQKLNIPDIILYLLTGMFTGPMGLNLLMIPSDSALNHAFLTLGAAVLLFHGGVGVQFTILKQVWRSLVLAATLSVCIMIFIVGYAVHWLLGIDLSIAFLLAAIIAPTDPAALVPIFTSVNIKEKLAQTIICESAFNDATAAIMTFTILAVVTTGEFSLGSTLSQFLRMAGGGILCGTFYGLISLYLISNRSNNMFANFSNLLVLPVIIGTYFSAEHFGASGFMAVFIAGILWGNNAELGWIVKETHRKEIASFIHIISTVFTIAIFVLLGSHIEFALLTKNLLSGLTIVGIFMFVARPIAVLAFALPDQKAKWQRNEIIFMIWTRETGVIPAVLLGMLTSYHLESLEIISSVVILTILITLILQPATTKLLAKQLNLLIHQNEAEK